MIPPSFYSFVIILQHTQYLCYILKLALNCFYVWYITHLGIKIKTYFYNNVLFLIYIYILLRNIEYFKNFPITKKFNWVLYIFWMHNDFFKSLSHIITHRWWVITYIFHLFHILPSDYFYWNTLLTKCLIG